MNTAIATRLLWKEYRQQRNLWIALLFGATLLQVIFWYFIEEPRNSDNEFMLLPLHIGTAMMMTSLFAVCSTAISFAIEREEGTHLRLVSLSCPPSLTLSVKFLTGLFGTTLLFLVSAAVGISLSTGFKTFTAKLGLASSQEAYFFVYWASVTIAGGLACGAFFSLLFRKVLPAVIASCVTVFVAGPILYGSWFASLSMPYRNSLDLRNRESVWLMVLVVASIGVLGLIDYLLVRWWMNRGFSESPRVRSRSLFRRLRVQRDGLDGSVTLEIGGADRAEFEVLTHDQARILPPPRFGLSLLYNNWGRGRARVLRFLCWKEMAESRRLFLIMLGIGVLLAAISGFEARSLAYNQHQIQQYRSPNWMPFAFTVSIVSMFVCGLMTFRGEQSQDSYRLLSDHGATPGYVWASKQIVWLGRLLAIPLTMLVVYSVILGFGLAQFEPRAVFRSQHDWDNLPALWWLTDCLKVVATLLTFYSVTQMASLAWRRAALSIFFALLCCILLGMWLGATVSFDVPVFAGILPLAPAMLLMTRLRTRGWLIGDDRFKRWLLPGTVGFLGIAACWFTTAAWRIFEIPTAQPIVATKTLDDGSTVATINGLTDAERQAILAPVSEEENAAALLYDRFGGPRGGESLREAVTLDACAFESPSSDTLLKRNVTRLQMYVRGDYFLRKAKSEAEAGNMADALPLIGDALKIARHAAGRGANRDFDQWRRITDNAMQALVEWSAFEGVTAELVAEATELVRTHIERSPDRFAVSFAHHRIVRNTLDLAYDEMATLRPRGESFDSGKYFEQYMVLKFPGTLRRIDRLIDWYETRSAKLIAEAKQFEVQGIRGGQNLGSWYHSQLSESTAHFHGRYDADHRQWLRTTPIPGGILDDVGLSIVFVDTNVKTHARGTQIAMNLHQARRESGELPATLEELALPPDVITDPWSGRPMQWFPEGLPNAIQTAGNTDPEAGNTIPAHTPLLFCGAASGAWLEETEVMVAVEEPFDPPAQIIPLQQDGQAEAGADSDATGLDGGLGQDNATAPQGQAGGASQAGAGQLGFGFDEGGMGSGMAPSNVRWEAQRQFVLRRPDSSQDLRLTPIFWLISPETPEDEAADDAN